MKLTIERKITAGFALALILVVSIGLIAYQNARSFIQSNQLVTHTVQVINEIEVILAMTADAETSARGFVITGDESYLEPYASANTAIGGNIQSLRDLVSDNPSQLSRVDTLDPLVQKRFKGLGNVISVRRESGFDVAQQTMTASNGKQTMDQIRSLLNDMKTTENSLFDQRTDASASSTQATILVFSIITLMGFGLLVSTYTIVRRDITGRKKAEQSLRTSEEKWRSLVENAPNLITTADLNGRIQFVNHITPGTSVNDVLGKTVSDVVQPEQREAVEQLVNQVIKTGQPADIEVSSARAQRHYTNRIGPIRVDGQITGVIVATTDITERKQAEERIQHLNQDLQRRTEQLELSNKELESFSYSVSHDLRTPLRAIDGFSQALLDDYGSHLDEDAKHYLDRIRMATQRMGHLIDDLIGLARLTRGEMRPKAINLSTMAKEVVSELQEAEPGRSIEFVIQDNLDAHGDPYLIRQVLANLLGNAWKFTRKQPQAHIEFGSLSKDNQPVYFVRDNGVGFDMAYADKLFKVFQRLHSLTEFDGTGIGLANVQRIVQRHGGKVWAEGQVNEGATFYFTLLSNAYQPQPLGEQK